MTREPWYSENLSVLKRKKCREYAKHRKSEKFLSLEKAYKAAIYKAKHGFANLHNLKISKPRQWYSQLKNLINYDQKSQVIEVESLKHLPDVDQANAIAEKVASISNEYEELDRSSIQIPFFSNEDIPVFEEDEVLDVLQALDINKSERKTDVPARIFKYFSYQLVKPITKLINDSVREGSWPDFLKFEVVTPIPKVDRPQSTDDLRPISGLMNLNKIIERLVSKLMLEDIKKHIDPAQYGNDLNQSLPDQVC